jgi:subtilisin family serine protease
MQQPTITHGPLPRYHDGMVIVKVRRSTAPSTFKTFADVANSPFQPHVTAAVSYFERAGRIRKITPLYNPQIRITPPALGFLGVMAHVSTAEPDSDPLAGVSIINMERNQDAQELRNALAQDPSVEFAAPVPVRYLMATVPTVSVAPTQVSILWNLEKIRWAQSRQLNNFRDALDVNVAVLDTGIDKNHPDLKSQIQTYMYAYPDIGVAASEQDLVGHGTHVSGTVTALINNNTGVKGVCQCRLHVFKIFQDQAEYVPAYGYFSYFVDPVMYRRALAECIIRKMDALNLSIGGPGEPDPQEALLFQRLIASGTAVVAAMGNEGESGSPTSYPAAIPGVIAVGATTIDDTVSKFSNSGAHIALCAPGEGIWSTLPGYPGQTGFRASIDPGGNIVQGSPIARDTDYASWSGTSMATPHVTGAAALVVATKGPLSPAQLKAALQASADRVSQMNGAQFTPEYGSGRLNLERLLSDTNQ